EEAQRSPAESEADSTSCVEMVVFNNRKWIYEIDLYEKYFYCKYFKFDPTNSFQIKYICTIKRLEECNQ
ncbi:hypothetical protein, partial [Rummeliibacillus pycnus]|uniref:hypothetical protein n=1 Tax=Rummeliibacillus pycnus TaxID=101070 RepID=UPI003D28310A